MNIETIIELLKGAGLEADVVYDGPSSICPNCREAEQTAAA